MKKLASLFAVTLLLGCIQASSQTYTYHAAWQIAPYTTPTVTGVIGGICGNSQNKVKILHWDLESSAPTAFAARLGIRRFTTTATFPAGDLANGRKARVADPDSQSLFAFAAATTDPSVYGPSLRSFSFGTPGAYDALPNGLPIELDGPNDCAYMAGDDVTFPTGSFFVQNMIWTEGP